ncbi:alanine--glyoxylate aminotransferase 2 homolog 3, mitochondrial-like [Impatiens glandulifera]|uniref:alanine--glyoxylate aminotransferase 2 homolog 3, mitochondrial-like n=1 Tax=Impatiens glandulifera TaxID=253017 RepID=UPI001FB15503|nr:alanine--glyoxylate aminotransferase 2 homolog 3, mitochondrial-like [Impatiens glandulifera]
MARVSYRSTIDYERTISNGGHNYDAFISGYLRIATEQFDNYSTALLEIDDVIPKMPPCDYSPPPYNGPSAAQILSKRRQFLNPSVFHLYKDPINLVDGKMQYLFDEDGRRYLDAFGGIATVSCGHYHPDVLDIVVIQMKRLQYSTVLYLHPAITDFAEALVSKLPGDLNNSIFNFDSFFYVAFFTNSGMEANELALMMARLYSGSNDIISIRNGYYGNVAATMGATTQSCYKFNVVQYYGVSWSTSAKWGSFRSTSCYLTLTHEMTTCHSCCTSSNNCGVGAYWNP